MRIDGLQKPEFGDAHYGQAATEGWIDVLKQRWRSAFAGFLLPVAAGLIFLLVADRQFQASATLLIEPAAARPGSADVSERLADSQVERAIDTQIEVLRTRLLQEAAVSLLAAEGIDLSEAGVEDKTSSAVQALDKMVTVGRRGASHVVDIEATSPDAALSAKVANALVSSYFNWRNNTASAAVTAAVDTLEGQTASLRAEFVDRDSELQAYRASLGVDPDHIYTQLASTQASVAAAQADLAEKQARLSQVEALGSARNSLNTMTVALDSATITDLKVQYAALLRQQADLDARYGPRHPEVLSGLAQLEAGRAELTAEIDRRIASVRNDAEVSERRLAALKSAERRLTSQAIAAKADEARLVDLQRSADSARDTFQIYLDRAQEISQSGSVQQTTYASVLTPAMPPLAPFFPNPVLILVCALAGGLALSFLAVAGLELLDQNLRSPRDVALNCPLPLIASLPQLRAQDLRLCLPEERHPAGYMREYPSTHYAESVRLVFTSLRLQSHEKSISVAVTSPRSGDGKSTTSLSLARSAAMAGERVLLIDCDLRRRSINSLLGLVPQVGLVEVVRGDRRWSEVAGDDEHGVVVLPVAERLHPAGNIFGGGEFAALLAELKQHFSLIILDCPPVLHVAESRTIVSLSDLTLVVARAGNTRRSELSSVCMQLSRFTANIAGVVLNGVKHQSSRATAYDYLLPMPAKIVA